MRCMGAGMVCLQTGLDELRQAALTLSPLQLAMVLQDGCSTA